MFAHDESVAQLTPEKQPTYVDREREREVGESWGMLVPNMHFASDKWRDK